MDSAAIKTTSEADIVLKEKGGNKEITQWENGKHSTCDSEWHGITDKVVYVHWHQRWSCSKGILPVRL